MSALLPRINLRRMMLIARRDYLGYVKTWGFWLSFIFPILFGAIGVIAGSSDFKVSPPRYETILDMTGQHEARIAGLLEENRDEARERIMEAKAVFIQDKAERETFKQILQSDGVAAAQDYFREKQPTIPADIEELDREVNLIKAPAETLEALKPYLLEQKTVRVDGKAVTLSGVLYLTEGEAPHRPNIEYWSPRFSSAKLQRIGERYLRRLSVENYMADSGRTREGYNLALDAAVSIEKFDPKKTVDTNGGSQEVTMTDRVPYFMAAGLSFILWLTIFSGSYMLLTSMLEEKLNKLLEMMLASTRFSEIIFGKLLGVAALTLTAMAPYLILGALGVVAYILKGPDQAIVTGLINSFSAKMIIFFVIYLVLGYILYGAFFIALGALSSSMQDAQTLTTPIMLIMTACIFVVPIGLNSPDSPVLTIASFIPFSAPFAAIIRLPSDPPLWQLIVSALSLLVMCVFVIAIAGRIFRFGVLSGSGAQIITQWFKRKVLRRKAQ